MSLTKSDLANRIHEKTGISIAESLRHVSAFFESVKSAVHDEGQVKFSGFGNFVVKDKKRRKGRNPQTGETMYISERKVLKFKPSLILKSDINKKYKNGSAK